MINKKKWRIGIIILVVALLLWSTLFLNYETMNANDLLSPPNSNHWFGTDDFGRDVFIRVIVGARYSIGASLFIVGLSYLGGMLLGGLAGIFGGWIDRIITSMLDIRNIKAREYVTVMYMQGAPLWYRMMTILKNIQRPLVTYMMVNISSTILSLATLSFLGIGVKVPQPEWGAMLNEGRLSFEQAPWLMIAPGLAITITIIIFNGIHNWIQQKERKS